MDIEQYIDFIRGYLDQYSSVATQYLDPDDFSYDALRHARTTEWTKLMAFREKYHTATEEEKMRLKRLLRGTAMLIDAAPDWEAQTSFLFDYATRLDIRAQNIMQKQG